MVAEGTPAQLKARVADQRLDMVLADGQAFEEVARSLGDRAIVSDASRSLLGVATDGSAAHVRALLDEIDPRCCAVSRFSVHSATLDDVFLALTGHTAARPEQETAGV